MTRLHFFSLFTFCLSSVAAPLLFSQSASTVPVGAVRLEALANSDSYYSIPLVRPSVYEGTVSAKSGNMLTLSGAAFATDALQYEAGEQPNTYYLQVANGSQEGQFSTVLSNTAGSVTCEFEDDILANLQIGDRVVIRPYWTLGTLFPADQEGKSFIASTGNLSIGRRTEICFPNTSSVGINKSFTRTFFYNQYWRSTSAGAQNANDTVIQPDSFIVIRGNGYSTSTALTVLGSVQAYANTVSLLSSDVGQNDNLVSLALPCDVTLSELGLISGGVFEVSSGNLSVGRGDELSIYDNGRVAQNKSFSATYFYNDYWRSTESANINRNDTVFPAGSVLIVRKKATTVSQVFDWHQPSAYNYENNL